MFDISTIESLINSQNTLALAIFGIIALLVFVLILATMFPFWRRVLINARLLEENERPASLLVWVVSIVIIVKLVQALIIQPFIVDGGSMLPTFHNREFLLVDKLSYRFAEPSRGDVAIFKLYEGGDTPYGGKHLIKRIIGLPNERIVIKNGTTTIYNESNPSGFVLEEEYVQFAGGVPEADMTLGPDEYFMMGDNRMQSYDSRSWGALKREDLKGQVLLRVYPFKSFTYEPGRHVYTK